MESQRSFLIIALAFVSFLLWQQWQIDNAPAPMPVAQTSPTNEMSEYIPASSDDIPKSEAVAKSTPVASSAEVINVKTNVLDLDIDTQGGDVVGARLLQYPIELGAEESLTLLTKTPGFSYVAQSGLVGSHGPDASRSGRPIYTADSNTYNDKTNSIAVPLTWSDEKVTVVKTFMFEPNSYNVTVKYQISNNTNEQIAVQPFAQLKQSIKPAEGSMMMPTYTGGTYSSVDTKYEKYDFEDMQDRDLKEITTAGWVAMIQHYFVSAWIPNSQDINELYSKVNSRNEAIIGFKAPVSDIGPGQTVNYESSFYVGPKDQEAMEAAAPYLDLTVDYGFLWWLSKPLFWLLKLLQSFVANWGIAIILITVIVKGIMYPLTKAQYTSMAKLRTIQPKMMALKERYGSDRQKMSQAMMELYKKEKVNPMGGCLPILLQMPIFLALYWVLLESVELRHAPFFGWITDLSVKDPYYVLPILMGASMFLLQKLQPTAVQDPMQQKIMQWMPVMFTFFFLWFPSGLVLYWLISNVISIIQAQLIYRALDKKGIGTK